MPEDVPFDFLLEMLEELYCEGSLEGQTKSRLVLWCSCVTKAKKSSGHKIKAEHEACVWQLLMGKLMRIWESIELWNKIPTRRLLL